MRDITDTIALPTLNHWLTS